MSPERELKHSQNFIRQPGVVRELLGLSNINLRDLVIEIGPGKGMITRELLKQAGRVIAVERDAKFAEELSSLNIRGNLQLVICDFLKWQPPQEEYKVFSNIPFNYTADIVGKLTSSDNLPTDIYLIMQEAAAYRFAGMRYYKNSQVSILTAVDFEVRIIRKIGRDYFEPRPKVSIVFAHFDRRPRPLVPGKDQQHFRDFVIYGYNQWAPTVLEAFSKIFSKKQLSIITRLQNLEGLKPSDLTLDQWFGLFDTYCRYANEDKQHHIRGSEKHLRNMQKKLDKRYRTRE
ncbi:MAG: rRNA adenine dimethyltransferase family protein [Chloroflexota bacterium]